MEPLEISPFEEAMFTGLIRHEEALRGLANPSWAEKVRIVEAARRRLEEIKRTSAEILASSEIPSSGKLAEAPTK